MLYGRYIQTKSLFMGNGLTMQCSDLDARSLFKLPVQCCNVDTICELLFSDILHDTLACRIWTGGTQGELRPNNRQTYIADFPWDIFSGGRFLDGEDVINQMFF